MPSKAIRNFHYEPSNRRLFVTFVTGRQYVYDEVPTEVYDAFLGAPSRGTFFNTEIRGYFDFREITPAHVRGSARPGMAPDRKTASRR